MRGARLIVPLVQCSLGRSSEMRWQRREPYFFLAHTHTHTHIKLGNTKPAMVWWHAGKLFGEGLDRDPWTGPDGEKRARVILVGTIPPSGARGILEACRFFFFRALQLA